MKDFNKARELALEAEQVLVPNRYAEPFVDAFQELTGIEMPVPRDRKQTVESDGKVYRYLRGRNIPKVAWLAWKSDPGTRTIGLTGGEWAAEYRASGKVGSLCLSAYQMTDKRLGRLAVIAPPSLKRPLSPSILQARDSLTPVVTVFKDLTIAFGASDQCNIFPEVVLDGGLESVSDMLGMPALDLVCKEETVRQNNFTIVKDLMDVYPTLVTVQGVSPDESL